MQYAVESANKFVTAAAWDGYILGPTANITENELRNGVGTVFHPVGTASMSPADASWGVVNPDLKLKGAKGVRIVDASVLVSHYSWMILPRAQYLFSVPRPASCTLRAYSGSHLYRRRESRRFDQSRYIVILSGSKEEVSFIRENSVNVPIYEAVFDCNKSTTLSR